MATKIIRYRPKNGDVWHFETEVNAITDFPDLSKYLTSDDVKSYSAGTGISISSSNVISTNPASSTTSGHVTISAQTFAGRKTFNGGINIASAGTLQLNGSSGSEGQIPVSHGTSRVATWTTPNFVTTDTEQTISAIKHFNVGLSAKNGITITEDDGTGITVTKGTETISYQSNRITRVHGSGIPVTNTFTFPNTSGQLALLSDITSGGGASISISNDSYTLIASDDSLTLGLPQNIGEKYIYFISMFGRFPSKDISDSSAPTVDCEFDYNAHEAISPIWIENYFAKRNVTCSFSISFEKIDADNILYGCNGKEEIYPQYNKYVDLVISNGTSSDIVGIDFLLLKIS